MIDCPEYAFTLTAFYARRARWEVYHTNPTCKALIRAEDIHTSPATTLPDPARHCRRCANSVGPTGPHPGHEKPNYVLEKIGKHEDDPAIEDLPELFEKYAGVV